MEWKGIKDMAGLICKAWNYYCKDVTDEECYNCKDCLSCEYATDDPRYAENFDDAYKEALKMREVYQDDLDMHKGKVMESYKNLKKGDVIYYKIFTYVKNCVLIYTAERLNAYIEELDPEEFRKYIMPLAEN